MRAGHEQKRARWLVVLALVIIAGLYPVGQGIQRDPSYPKEYSQPIYNVREGGTLAIMAMLGGFRPIVSSLLWLKADEYWHMGGTGWWRIIAVLQAVCDLDPHFIDAWSTFAWHCAYNIYVDAAPEDRPRWVETGLRILKRGQYFNPNRYELFKEEAWIYHDKLRDYERAIPAWQETLKKPDAPLYVRHMLAHCYEITWQPEKALQVWQECLRLDPRDHVARSAVDWWTEQLSTPEKTRAELLRILERENGIRKTRNLPLMEQPRAFH